MRRHLELFRNGSTQNEREQNGSTHNREIRKTGVPIRLCVRTITEPWYCPCHRGALCDYFLKEISKHLLVSPCVGFSEAFGFAIKGGSGGNCVQLATDRIESRSIVSFVFEFSSTRRVTVPASVFMLEMMP